MQQINMYLMRPQTGYCILGIVAKGCLWYETLN